MLESLLKRNKVILGIIIGRLKLLIDLYKKGNYLLQLDRIHYFFFVYVIWIKKNGQAGIKKIIIMIAEASSQKHEA